VIEGDIHAYHARQAQAGNVSSERICTRIEGRAGIPLADGTMRLLHTNPIPTEHVVVGWQKHSLRDSVAPDHVADH
jgi:hypothetical protein